MSKPSKFPQVVALLSDSKPMSADEIAETLQCTSACIRMLIRDSRRGFLSHHLHVADFRHVKGRDIALWALGNKPDRKLETVPLAPPPVPRISFAKDAFSQIAEQVCRS